MISNNRPTKTTIDLSALRANFAAVQARVGDSVSVLAAVKANAYGLGAIECAHALSDAGCKHFGVATIEEGVELRQAGVKGEIISLAGVFGVAKRALEFDISPTIFRMEDAIALNEFAKSQNLCQRVHLKVDTGMFRIGVSLGEWSEFLRALTQLSSLHVAGIATHFANSDDKDLDRTRLQNERFMGALAVAKELGFSPELIHAANSSAAMRLPDSHYNMVRAGIALYGVDPSQNYGDALSSVLTMETAIIQLKKVPAGEGVSYSHTWVAPVDSTLAVLPVGYADGYKRALSNRADVVIRGVRCPVRGNICMDLTMVDVTDLEGSVSVGDRVELIGEVVGPHELSQHADTIPYEIFTGISLRVPRNYR